MKLFENLVKIDCALQGFEIITFFLERNCTPPDRWLKETWEIYAVTLDSTPPDRWLKEERRCRSRSTPRTPPDRWLKDQTLLFLVQESRTPPDRWLKDLKQGRAHL